MSKTLFRFQSLVGGISDNPKQPGDAQFSFGRSLENRRDSSQTTILPGSEILSTLSDLPMWGASACSNLYFLGNTGHIYQVSDSTLTDEYTVPDSVGNGLAYFPEDKYLYNASNTTIGRRSTACTTGSYTDAFLENEGGDPTNTKSIDLESTSSQYASVADNAEQSITGDLTIETWMKPESLPSSGNEMVLVSKWDENTNLRSYRFYIDTVSNFFGDGSDGALVISSNTTETVIDSACSGTSGTTTLSATNASFAAGQKILIHQTRGTNAGTYQITTIQGYTAGTITTEDTLDISYNSTSSNKAQVRVLKQYTDVTVNTGVTWTAKAWNGTVGGILAFLANGTVTVTGSITAGAKGYLGGSDQTTYDAAGKQGEGTAGARDGLSKNANGSGGGGAEGGATEPASDTRGGGGGGGGHASSGSTGENRGTGFKDPGIGGNSAGDSLLSSVVFGGGGGSGSPNDKAPGVGGEKGGNGGGIICLFGSTVTITGEVRSSGGAGDPGTVLYDGGGGGGAGGSVLVKCQTASLGSNGIIAAGGSGGGGGSEACDGGNGSSGRIAVYYSSSVSGTTSPTYSSTEDSDLGSADGYALNLDISDDGTATETYQKEASIVTDSWQHAAVKIDVSASTATFYLDGTSLGTDTGSMTSIDDNASVFGIGCDFNSSAQNFYDGLLDDTRLWNDLRSDTEIQTYKDKSLGGAEGNLASYYEFEGDVTDSTTASNDLTASGSPTYSTDVPFVGVSTRGDEDVFDDVSGQTYTLTTAINEGATHVKSFVPTKEPMKSLALNVNTVGTGDWTIVIHDAQNRELTSLTVANGTMTTGVYEFVFDSVIRPVRNATYHIHVYSTVADGIVVTGTTTDFSDAYLKTYYQILVSDEYHPMRQFLNFLAIGNERYLSILEAGNLYTPHRITLPSGYRIRSLASWNEYLAVGVWRGTSITDSDDGKIFFWDGTSDEFVEPLDVPQGGINSLFGHQGTLTFSAGYEGKIMEWRGGPEAQVVKQLPRIESTDYVELAPASITMWKSLIRIGGSFNTNSTTLHKGVYSWGRYLSSHPESLGYDYPTSLGDQTASNVSIGVVYPYGQKLYVGWKNSNSYGLDVVDSTNDPYATATIEYPRSDMGLLADNMVPLAIKTSFLPLTSGQSVVLKYKVDRGNWFELGTQSTTGATEIRKTISRRMRELDLAIDITTNGEQVTILETAGEIEDEQQSRRV